MNFLESPEETPTWFSLFKLNLIHVGSFFLFPCLHFLLVKLLHHIDFSKTIRSSHRLKKILDVYKYSLICTQWVGGLRGLERDIYRGFFWINLGSKESFQFSEGPFGLKSFRGGFQVCRQRKSEVRNAWEGAF